MPLKTSAPESVGAKKSPSLFVWLVWGAALSFVIFQFAVRISHGVMAQDLMSLWQLDGTEYGWIGSIFYFGYAACQIPAGYLLDRYGPGRILPLFCGLCVGGFWIFSNSDTLPLILLGRFITGIGSAGAFIGSLKVVRLVFPGPWFGTMVGVTSSLGLALMKAS